MTAMREDSEELSRHHLFERIGFQGHAESDLLDSRLKKRKFFTAATSPREYYANIRDTYATCRYNVVRTRVFFFEEGGGLAPALFWRLRPTPGAAQFVFCRRWLVRV